MRSMVGGQLLKYGQKSNKLVKYGVPVNRYNDPIVQRVMQPNKKLVHERQSRIAEEKEKVENTNKKFVIEQWSTTGNEESAHNT